MKMPHIPVPVEELNARLTRLRGAMQEMYPDWSMIILDNKIDLYYFTGAMPDGLLLVTPEKAALYVRRSFEISKAESNFGDIREMKSFRGLPQSSKTVHVSAQTLTLKKHAQLQKYMGFTETVPIDGVLAALRSVKSEYELQCMRQSGLIHRKVIEDAAPSLLREGMSEARLCMEICTLLVEHGTMGISRFGNSAGEDVLGIASFGENTLRPAGLDTPSGTAGTCIAMKSIGSSKRRLQNDELVLLDIPGGFRGYHTDKSVTFFFGSLSRHPKGDVIRAAHEQCIALERDVAAMLVPGAAPEEIYEKMCNSVDPAFRDGFMNTRRFTGHSIGLYMDETPVLAKGFTQPIKEGMTFAVEPKIAIEGVGLVGCENTYEVVGNGPARSLTGRCDTQLEVSF